VVRKAAKQKLQSKAHLLSPDFVSRRQPGEVNVAPLVSRKGTLNPALAVGKSARTIDAMHDGINRDVRMT
jgi:hypothetical protein